MRLAVNGPGDVKTLRSRLAGAGVLCALLASGCLPFAVPPAKVGFAVGPRAVPQSTLPERFTARRGGAASQCSATGRVRWLPIIRASLARITRCGLGRVADTATQHVQPLLAPAQLVTRCLRVVQKA
jgi:hypothetical protein